MNDDAIVTYRISKPEAQNFVFATHEINENPN